MSRRLLVADAVRTASAIQGDAVLIDAQRIVGVGRATEMREPGLPEDRYPGATIVPGLRDAHLHPVGYAAALNRPSLKSAGNFAGIADIITDAAAVQPTGSAITALRLDDESLAEGRLPDRDLLDRVAPTHPVLLIRYCGHVMVANSAALGLAGIDDRTPDPTGGSMDRDAAGRLTGVLRETACDPVSIAVRGLVPPIGTDQIVTAATALASVGLTGVGAMASTDAGCWAGAGSEVDALVDAAMEIPITMGVMVIARDVPDLERAVDRLAHARGHVSFLGVKIFADGSLGGHTAAMYEAFSDLPGERGTNRLDPDFAEGLARASLRLGGRVAIHAIGDKANASVLDLMERLIGGGADPAMLRVEHASVLTEADVVRFGQLGVTASIQPAFMASETEWLHKRVGPERLERTYAFRSLAAAGAPLAGGSDCPVEPPHPLPNMASARDRCGIGPPAEELTGSEALSLFTEGSGRAIGEEATLRPGAPASFTILDADPVTATPTELRTMTVLDALVLGKSAAVPEGLVTWQG